MSGLDVAGIKVSASVSSDYRLPKRGRWTRDRSKRGLVVRTKGIGMKVVKVRTLED